ncbi:MAG: response regulator [Thermoguttaceae bacterium]|jgi:FixJ family two-component response regulator|nr:response regulator [Thermoguttaceae bacterium]
METAAPLVRQDPTVFVVDSDPRVVQMIRLLARPLDFQPEFYSEAEEFLGACDPAFGGCVLLNLDLPGLSDLGVFERLSTLRIHLPVVALSARDEVAYAVQAMKAGAVDYLSKPCAEVDLERALREALQWDAEHRQEILFHLKMRHRMEQLTSGEQEVLWRLIEGLSNREVAAELGRSVRAIEARRARVMDKMKAKSLPELVRMVLAAQDRCPPRTWRLE